MRMLEEIVLLGKTVASGPNGYPEESVTGTTVYADVMSVSQSEYYAAQAIKRRAEIVFVINADEYAGQTEVRYDGKSYDVVRAAQAYDARSKLRLTCARR